MDDATTAPAATPVETVTLADFCRLLSGRDRRVELIAMFHHGEVVANRLNDTAAAYAARYAATATQPVN